MRVIAGEAKGRPLAAVRGGATRAATDRIRETLFGILTPEVAGAVVLDLFAGAGTLGVEALSRGAGHATFVERAAMAVATIRRNLASTGLAERATVLPANVIAFLASPGGPYDLVFCDPPFADVAVLEATLRHPALPMALAPGALVVARVLRKHPPALPPNAHLVRAKEIGEERLLFVEYGPARTRLGAGLAGEHERRPTSKAR